MENSHSAAYAAAGVDITAGYEGVRLMKPFVERTKIPGVVSGIRWRYSPGRRGAGPRSR